MNLSPKTVREQVTDQIRDELAAGKFEAGTMLRETELAKRFGVSRGPIRDAFIQLSHEGFLAYQANRGVMVRQPPDPSDRKFIASLRVQIELRMIEKGLSQMTASSIQLIELTLKQLIDACRACDAGQVALRDLEFHESILVACGGEDFAGVWRQLCSRMLLTYTRLDNYDQAIDEHVAIFEAIRSRDVAKACEGLRANIR